MAASPEAMAGAQAIAANPAMFAELVNQLQQPDNDARRKGEDVFEVLKLQPDLCMQCLVTTMRTSSDVTARAFCAIMLRKVRCLPPLFHSSWRCVPVGLLGVCRHSSPCSTAGPCASEPRRVIAVICTQVYYFRPEGDAKAAMLWDRCSEPVKVRLPAAAATIREWAPCLGPAL